MAVALADKAPGDSGGMPARRVWQKKSVTRSGVTRVEGLGVMWPVDQPHQGDWRNLRFRLGGPTNLRTGSPEFGIDAKREELSILTVLPIPIASSLGVWHRSAIGP